MGSIELMALWGLARKAIMMICYKCGTCGAPMQSPVVMAGGMERCPSCASLTPVPESSQRPSAKKPWPALYHWLLAVCFALPPGIALVTVLVLEQRETLRLRGQLAVAQEDLDRTQCNLLSEESRSKALAGEAARAARQGETADSQAANWEAAAVADRTVAATAEADARRWQTESEQRGTTIEKLEKEAEFLRSQANDWQKLAIAVAIASTQSPATQPAAQPAAPMADPPAAQAPAGVPPKPDKGIELAALQQSLSVAKASGRASLGDRAQLRQQYDSERAAVEKAYQDKLLLIQRQFQEEVAVAPMVYPPPLPPPKDNGQFRINRAGGGLGQIGVRDTSGAVQRRAQRIQDAQTERDRALREIDARYQPQFLVIDATIRRLEAEVILLTRRAAEIMAVPMKK